MRPLRKIGFILLALVLLPALMYVANRVHSLNQDEALIEQIYDQQLETILFSVNQYAWDVANDWAGGLERVLMEDGAETEAVQAFLGQKATLHAVFLADTSLQSVQMIASGAPVRFMEAQDLTLSRGLVRRLVARKKIGYRQLEPLVIAGDGTTIALVFMAHTARGARAVGMLFEAGTFVADVLTPKLMEVARSRFALGVFTQGREAPVYATDTLRVAEVRQQRTLWLFPDYTLGIRLRGASLAEVVQGRLRRDLGFIGILALVLLGGAWLVYHNVRREMDLARIKSAFVSNVSHELRTPLSLIRMYVETLELGRVSSDAQRRRYYRIINQETLRLSRLINNILNFSRIESGLKNYALGPTDLNAVVRDVLDRYTFTLDRQGFETAVHLGVTLPLVHGDAGAMAEALINLIDNAAKYSTDEKALALTTEVDDDGVYIEVADRGIGIAPEEQDRIFDAFYRASGNLVHDTKGTGLGLALVHHIMEAHGGRVTVRSRPGQGSRFRLHFRPVEDASGPLRSLQGAAAT